MPSVATGRVARLQARVDALLKTQAELEASFEAQRAALALELEQRATLAERERDALRRSYERRR